VPGVSLRPVEDADLDALFDQMRGPESVWMAAFTARGSDDRAAFDARMARLRRSPPEPRPLSPRDGTGTSRKPSSG